MTLWSNLRLDTERKCVCVWVGVCVRERERERMMIWIYCTSLLLQIHIQELKLAMLKMSWTKWPTKYLTRQYFFIIWHQVAFIRFFTSTIYSPNWLSFHIGIRWLIYETEQVIKSVGLINRINNLQSIICVTQSLANFSVTFL